jgi:hypothetical protein
MARHLHGFRHRISLVDGSYFHGPTLSNPGNLPCRGDLIETQVGSMVRFHPGIRREVPLKREMVPVPEFTDSGATRATAAAIGCYLFASLTD